MGQRKPPVAISTPKPKPETQIEKTPKSLVRRKLSFKEQRELETLPQKIEKLELEQEELYALMADITFYQKDPKEVSQKKSWLETIESELLRSYERWENLEEAGEEEGGLG